MAILEVIGQNIVAVVLIALAAYLLGSISFAIIVTHFARHRDIRDSGSGNAGATNVLRSVGKLPALLTLLGDVGKAVAAILLGRLIFSVLAPEYPLEQFGFLPAYIAGLFCFLGHLYPCYFGFKGGKGVLTAAGMMGLIDWRALVFCLAAFGVVFLITHIVSVSSVAAAAFYPIATFVITYFFKYLPQAGASGQAYQLSFCVFETVMALLIGLIVIVKHRSNLKRLVKGEEKKIF